MLLLEFLQEVVYLLVLRHEVGLTDMVLPLEVFLLVGVLQEVLDVEDTLHVVDGVLVDGEAGVFRLAYDLEHGVEIAVEVHVHDVHARLHDLVDADFTEVHHAPQDLFLVGRLRVGEVQRV